MLAEAVQEQQGRNATVSEPEHIHSATQSSLNTHFSDFRSSLQCQRDSRAWTVAQ